MTQNSHSRMTRKNFPKTAAMFSASALSVEMGSAQPRYGSRGPIASKSNSVTLENSQWQLVLDPGAGLKTQLVHSPCGIALASGEYNYSIGLPTFGEAQESKNDKTRAVRLLGEIPGGIELQHEFRISIDKPWLEEQISISCRGLSVLSIPYGRCGFVLPLTLEGGALTGPLRDSKATAVPYRREPHGNRTQYADYTLGQALCEPRNSHLRAQTQLERSGNVVLTAIHGSGFIQTFCAFHASEGWTHSDGRRKNVLRGVNPSEARNLPLDILTISNMCQCN